MPRYVTAHALSVNDQGVVLAIAGVLGYENSVATFDCGFDAPRAQLAEIVGTDATISWDGFIGPDDPTHCAFTLSVTADPNWGVEGSLERIDVPTPMPQAASLIERFSSDVLQGSPQNPFWPEISLKTQRVVDAVQESWKAGGTKVQVLPLLLPAAKL